MSCFPVYIRLISPQYSLLYFGQLFFSLFSKRKAKTALKHFSALIFHLCAEKSSLPVAEQCAWAVGNVAGEGEELRNILLAQGALTPLARMMLPDKGSTVRTAAWALSNLIKVLRPSSYT